MSTLTNIVKPKVIRLEKLYLDEVCRNEMTITDLVNWLLGGHIHIILTHIHQGFATHGSLIDMENMMQQLLRLRFHIGYPNGASLYCPVFTQDKRRYLLALGELANNTLFIPLNMTKKSFRYYHDQIKRYDYSVSLTSTFYTKCSQIHRSK